MHFLNFIIRFLKSLSFHKLKTAVFILLFYSLNSFSQIYPVQISNQLIPPYSGYLPDYADPSSEKLKVILQFNDFNIAQYNVRLKIEIKGNGFSLVTKQFFNPPPITIQPGIPFLLSGADLAPYLNSSNLDFIGINKSQYEQRMALPEGYYTICIKAYDYYNPGNIQISNEACTQAWFTLSDPPFLNLPACGSSIVPQTPQNLVFQWTPMNMGSPLSAANTEYEFALWEVRPDSAANPNQIVLSTAPIYSVTTNITTLNYGITEPALNLYMKYVWRVRVKDNTGRDWFKNNGYSQICTFTYGNVVSVLGNALNLTLSAQGVTHRLGLCTWNTQSLFTNYLLQVRKQGSNNWFDYPTVTGSEKVTNLEPNTNYEARVRGESSGITGDWSNTANFITQNQPNYTCNDQTILTTPLQAQPLSASKAIPGLIIQSGQFEVTVSQISSSGATGWYSGKGVANVYGGHPVAVEFTNIFIDDNNMQLQGTIQATTKGLDKWLQQWDVQYAEEHATYVNGTLDSVFVRGNQVCVVIQGNPNDSCFNFPAGQNAIVVRDENGNQYTITLKPPPPKVTGPKNYFHYSEDNLGANDSTMVTFAASATQQYGFDKKQYLPWINNYENIKLSNGKSYFVPYKSVGENNSDEVIASLHIMNFVPNLLSFKTKGGAAVTAVASSTPDQYKVTVPDNAESVYAWYKNKKIGKLNVVSLKAISRKVVVVPVNNANLSVSNLQNELNKIYKQANVSWSVTVKPSFTFSLGTDGLEAADATLMTKYSTEMRALRNAYRTADSSYDKSAYFIFVVPNFTDPNIKGYMVRGRAMGFASQQANLKEIAHELAHGAFGLEHTFPEITKSSSQNLMDYASGVDQTKLQWDLIQNAPKIFTFLDNEENSSFQTDGHYSTIYLIGKMLRVPQYKLLAWYTEAPDNLIHEKYAIVQSTWAERDHQLMTHALTFGYHSIEEFKTSVAFMNADRNNYVEMGRLLHRYGDCFAHTRLEDSLSKYVEKRMYGDTINFIFNVLGITTEHMSSDGAEPDLIGNRPNWYMEYVKNVVDLISLKFGKQSSSVDFSLFEYLANYAKQKHVSLIGIINYEIAISENKKEFTIPYPISNGAFLSTNAASADEVEYEKWVENTKEYLKNKKISYKFERASGLVPMNGSAYVPKEAKFILE